jgi:hypothetical protein
VSAEFIVRQTADVCGRRFLFRGAWTPNEVLEIDHVQGSLGHARMMTAGCDDYIAVIRKRVAETCDILILADFTGGGDVRIFVGGWQNGAVVPALPPGIDCDEVPTKRTTSLARW